MKLGNAIFIKLFSVLFERFVDIDVSEYFQEPWFPMFAFQRYGLSFSLNDKPWIV